MPEDAISQTPEDLVDLTNLSTPQERNSSIDSTDVPDISPNSCVDLSDSPDFSPDSLLSASMSPDISPQNSTPMSPGHHQPEALDF